MSGHQSSSNLSMPELSAEVTERQDKLQQFFRKDWTRLRQLILELEESTWTEGNSSAVFQLTSDEASGECETAVVDQSSNTEPNGQSGDRLSDLDAAIEQRIRLAESTEE